MTDRIQHARDWLAAQIEDTALDEQAEPHPLLTGDDLVLWNTCVAAQRDAVLTAIKAVQG